MLGEESSVSLVEQAKSLIESEGGGSSAMEKKPIDLKEEQRKSDQAVKGALAYGIPATLNGQNENV